MSVQSDRFERSIAKNINSIPGVTARLASGATKLSDVKVTLNKVTTYVEVKMAHDDNLANPRIYYKAGKWNTTYKTPAAHKAVDLMNSSAEAREFVRSIADFAKIPYDRVSVPTSVVGLRDPNAVPIEVMTAFFSSGVGKRYIVSKGGMDVGSIAEEHYTKGKDVPAFYMQAADDFYLISKRNPLRLASDIPLLAGTGDFKVRVSILTTRPFYEVQAEIKVTKMPHSKYSIKPGTSKKNPFLSS